MTFLHAQGAEWTEVCDLTELPSEFLKDPTCWLDARKVDDFLGAVELWSLQKFNIEKPLEKMGHAAADLRAWGVLDSVLRMIAKPDDIFMQPQRFISYFISPAPPIANTRWGPSSVSFDVPISFEEYSHVANYLRSAIEAVPVFMGAPTAEAQWRQNTISISWHSQQEVLFDSSLERKNLAPAVMDTLVSTLEKTEQALLQKTRELEKIKRENLLAAQSQLVEPSQIDPLSPLRRQQKEFEQQVLRLQDYFTRSQQLVTLLVAQDRKNPQVREAMRRVNWEHVQEQYPKVMTEIMNLLENKTENATENENGENFQSPRPRDLGQPWLPHN
jgi:hypothetical protein